MLLSIPSYPYEGNAFINLFYWNMLCEGVFGRSWENPLSRNILVVSSNLLSGIFDWKSRKLNIMVGQKKKIKKYVIILSEIQCHLKDDLT